MSSRSQYYSIFELAWELWHRRRGLALLVFPITFAAVLSLIWGLPDLYKASATVMIEQTRDNQRAIATTGEDQIKSRLHAVSQQILSRSRLQDLVQRFDLYPEMRKTAPTAAVVERMRRDITLEREEVGQAYGSATTVAFTLGYRGWEPDTVANVTNTLAAMYVNENERIRQNEAESTASVLKDQLEEVQVKLERQEQKVSDFKNRFIGQLPGQQDANLATLERYNAQLRLNNEDQIRAIERRERLLEGRASAGGSSESTAARLSRLKQELAEMKSRYSDKYPDVIRLESEIAALKRQLPRGAGAPAENDRAGSGTVKDKLGDLNQEIARLKQEEQRLQAKVEEYQSRIENAPKLEQDLQELTRDYNAIQELYSSLLKRYEEAKLAETREQEKGEQFQILEAAVPPDMPVGPDKIRLALMGFILCFGLTGGLVFLAEQLDTSLHSSSELRDFTRVPILATIPAIVTRGDIWRRRFRLTFVTLLATAGVLLVIRASYLLGKDNEQIVWMLTQQVV